MSQSDMPLYLDKLSLVDLVSEQHKQLRELVMQRVQPLLAEHLSETELYLLALAHYQTMNISEAARHMRVSRQSAHKSSQRLCGLGYVELVTSLHNKRDKTLALTAAGVTLFEQVEEIKRQMEQQICVQIGQENLALLRQLFSQTWL